MLPAPQDWRFSVVCVDGTWTAAVDGFFEQTLGMGETPVTAVMAAEGKARTLYRHQKGKSNV